MVASTPLSGQTAPSRQSQGNGSETTQFPLGFGALLPHGPPNKDNVEKKEANEQPESDYGGLITKIEEELCTIEGREGKEAATRSGSKDGVA